MSRRGELWIADLLVERGLAEYRPNPAHRRAKLLACSEASYWAIRCISMAAHPWCGRIAHDLDADELQAVLDTMHHLIDILERH